MSMLRPHTKYQKGSSTTRVVVLSRFILIHAKVHVKYIIVL